MYTSSYIYTTKPVVQQVVQLAASCRHSSNRLYNQLYNRWNEVFGIFIFTLWFQGNRLDQAYHHWKSWVRMLLFWRKE